MNFLKKLVDSEYKELKRFEKLADQIEGLSEEMSKLKDGDFKKRTEEFKKEINNGKKIDDIIIPAMALAREACFRGIGEKPYRVQIIGALAIYFGNIAENCFKVIIHCANMIFILSLESDVSQLGLKMLLHLSTLQ